MEYEHPNGNTYLLYEHSGENIVTSEEGPTDPDDCIKLGTWTGDINDNPTVTLD